MSTTLTCPQCGKSLPKSAPMELCPECLMKAGFLTGGIEPSYTLPTRNELTRLFPDLEIFETLGRGGMGVVYKARQRELDRLVALKILPSERHDPAFAERFSREARALAKLGHPHIVTIHDFGQRDGLFYFIMEYVDGLNLRQLLTASKITPQEALAIVPQICEALQYAHSHGIVHRDIKPENILLDKQGRVKIADFGLAKIANQGAPDLGLTMAGEVMGTPHYMAPEQVERPQSVDHRADIYSLGVVFYQMLTGELPLGYFAPPSRKVQIDVRLDEVVLRALEKEPDLRYQQAGAMKTQVETIMSTPDSMRQTADLVSTRNGFEYKSKRKLWGLPLLHVALGYDSATGKSRQAKGVLAIGNSAKGIFAFGGWSLGIFAWGGLAFGVVPFGGLSVGLFALGGMAAGLLFAFGGMSISALAAVGGAAIGYFANGGWVMGVHAWGGNARDPLARSLLGWIPDSWGYIGFQVLMVLCLIIQMGVPWWLQKKNEKQASRPQKKPSFAHSYLLFFGICAAIFLTAGLVVSTFFYSKKVQHPEAEGKHVSITQSGTTDIQPDGLVRFDGVFERPNLSGVTATTYQFVNSDFVHIDQISDRQGRPLRFTARPGKGNLISYEVTLNEPVPSGGMLYERSEGTSTGLVKATESDVFEYHMNHFPSCGAPVRYEQTYRLPAGATVLSKSPASLQQREVDNRIELSTESVIPANGSIDIRFSYRLGKKVKTSGTALTKEQAIESAQALIRDLESEQFQKVYDRFDDGMKREVPVSRLAEGWKQVSQAGGAYKGRGQSICLKDSGYQVVSVLCQWERLSANVKVSFGPDGQVAGLLLTPSQTSGQTGLPQAQLAHLASDFVRKLEEGKFEEATGMFDDQMKSALSTGYLKQIWQQLNQNGGKYNGQGAPAFEKKAAFDVVYIPCLWEKNPIDLKIVFNPAGKISGLWVWPPRGGK